MSAPRMARFEVYPTAGEWRWRLVAGNGEVLASGEGFTRKRDAQRATRAVRFAAPLARTVEGTR